MQQETILPAASKATSFLNSQMPFNSRVEKIFAGMQRGSVSMEDERHPAWVVDESRAVVPSAGVDTCAQVKMGRKRPADRRASDSSGDEEDAEPTGEDMGEPSGSASVADILATTREDLENLSDHQRRAREFDLEAEEDEFDRVADAGGGDVVRALMGAQESRHLVGLGFMEARPQHEVPGTLGELARLPRDARADHTAAAARLAQDRAGAVQGGSNAVLGAGPSQACGAGGTSHGAGPSSSSSHPHAGGLGPHEGGHVHAGGGPPHNSSGALSHRCSVPQATGHGGAVHGMPPHGGSSRGGLGPPLGGGAGSMVSGLPPGGPRARAWTGPVPDHVLHPHKYKHYTLEWSDEGEDEDERNRAAARDALRSARRNAQATDTTASVQPIGGEPMASADEAAEPPPPPLRSVAFGGGREGLQRRIEAALSHKGTAACLIPAGADEEQADAELMDVDAGGEAEVRPSADLPKMKRAGAAKKRHYRSAHAEVDDDAS